MCVYVRAKCHGFVTQVGLINVYKTTPGMPVLCVSREVCVGAVFLKVFAGAVFLMVCVGAASLEVFVVLFNCLINICLAHCMRAYVCLCACLI